MPALAAAGHEVLFWHESGLPSSTPSIKVASHITSVSVAEVGRERALALLEAWRPDIVYAQGLTDPALEEAAASVAPTVFFFHAYYGTCVSGTKRFLIPRPVACGRQFGLPCLVQYFPRRCGGLSPLTMFRQYFLQRSRLELLQRFAAVITHSDHMKAELLQHGVVDDRVFKVPYLAVTSGFAPPRRLREIGTVTLLFAGRMEPDKGGHYLIAAAPMVARALRRPVRVVFAGTGRAEVDWRDRAVRLNSRDLVSVDFRGWVSSSDLELLYAEADLLVVPSIWPEPYGQVGPEAASRCPAGGRISRWRHHGVAEGWHRRPSRQRRSTHGREARNRNRRVPEGPRALRSVVARSSG